MRAEEIKKKVIEIVQDICAKPEIVDEDTLLEVDLGLDYLDVVELIIEIEDELHISIDEDDIGMLKTVGGIVRAAQQALGPVDIIEERLDSKEESVQLERR